MIESEQIADAVKALEKKVEHAGYFVIDKNRESIKDVMKALEVITDRLDKIEKKLSSLSDGLSKEY